jgi:hypothetical protein
MLSLRKVQIQFRKLKIFEKLKSVDVCQILKLRNKALAGAFEVTNYTKGKEGTQFGDKINRMYPQGAECIFCDDPREDFYHILVKCLQWKEDQDNIKRKVSEISQTNVEGLVTQLGKVLT